MSCRVGAAGLAAGSAGSVDGGAVVVVELCLGSLRGVRVCCWWGMCCGVGDEKLHEWSHKGARGLSCLGRRRPWSGGGLQLWHRDL